MAALATDASGLTGAEAATRLKQHGPNRIDDSKRRHLLADLGRRLANPLVAILLAASAVAGATGDMVSFAIIVAMVLLSSILDMVQERRAHATAEALKRSIALLARVQQDGQPIIVPVTAVVPGDVIDRAAGDLIPADGIALAATSAQVNQAALTGEPYPADKRPEFVADAALADAEPPTAFERGIHRLGLLIVQLAHLARTLALSAHGLLPGEEIASLSDDALAARVEKLDLFARITPNQKLLIVKALQARGHTVGFLGDGINDVPAIRAAGVGLSVDSATDLAREAADIILLAPDLNVLADGAMEERRTYANIMKYIRMGTSSNFGNMLNMALASQILVVFIIRTSQPFWRDRPHPALVATALGCLFTALLIPFLPLAGRVGFTTPPPRLVLVIAALVAVYLLAAEGLKQLAMRRWPARNSS